MTPTPSEQAAAVLNLIDKGVIGWDEPEVMRVLKAASKEGAPRKNLQQRNASPLKLAEQSPSGWMSKAERDRIPKIRFDLAQEGITPKGGSSTRWRVERR